MLFLIRIVKEDRTTMKEGYGKYQQARDQKTKELFFETYKDVLVGDVDANWELKQWEHIKFQMDAWVSETLYLWRHEFLQDYEIPDEVIKRLGAYELSVCQALVPTYKEIQETVGEELSWELYAKVADFFALERVYEIKPLFITVKSKRALEKKYDELEDLLSNMYWLLAQVYEAMIYQEQSTYGYIWWCCGPASDKEKAVTALKSSHLKRLKMSDAKGILKEIREIHLENYQEPAVREEPAPVSATSNGNNFWRWVWKSAERQSNDIEMEEWKREKTPLLGAVNSQPYMTMSSSST